MIFSKRESQTHQGIEALLNNPGPQAHITWPKQYHPPPPLNVLNNNYNNKYFIYRG